MSRYVELATQAAELEREQRFYEAESMWREALLQALRLDNRDWCRSRAEFCGHARRWVARGLQEEALA